MPLEWSPLEDRDSCSLALAERGAKLKGLKSTAGGAVVGGGQPDSVIWLSTPPQCSEGQN